MTQPFELNFDGGISTKYHSLLDCVDDCISRSPYQKKVIAADLDLSPSGLSRRLTEHVPGSSEPVFSLCHLERYIEKYNDLKPIYYLVEKFCQNPDDQKRQAIAQLAQMMPLLQKLITEAK